MPLEHVSGQPGLSLNLHRCARRMESLHPPDKADNSYAKHTFKYKY
jgi:hypothetical protein